jgi:tetratricopeptide (TPR) repeat protein
LLRGDNALADARAYYQKAFEVQNGLVSRNAQEAVAAQQAPDSSLKSNLAATYTHWGLLEQGAGNFELALEKLRQGVALDEELTKNEPGNPQWQEFLTPNYLYLAQILEGLKRSDDALTYYRKLNDARRTLAYRAPGRPKPQQDLAEAAKLLGDRSTSLAQIEAYREAVRSWNRLVDDPRNADAAADQYDVVLGFAHVFDAKKDWPDAQSAYRVAMKIAVLNYVKDPSATSWRDKAEEAERASVVAGKAAESVPTDAPR